MSKTEQTFDNPQTGNSSLGVVMQSSIDRKIEKLIDLTMQFIFIEHYTHTGEAMYKILNPYTNYKEEKLVLCSVNEGIEKALDIAYEQIKQKRDSYFASPTAMKRCRQIRYNLQINNKMSKENENSDKQKNGNDFIADVMQSAFAVIPDAERLDIGSNKIIAVFQHRHQAEDWAKSMWEKYYIIKEVSSSHFA